MIGIRSVVARVQTEAVFPVVVSRSVVSRVQADIRSRVVVGRSIWSNGKFEGLRIVS